MRLKIPFIFCVSTSILSITGCATSEKDENVLMNDVSKTVGCATNSKNISSDTTLPAGSVFKAEILTGMDVVQRDEKTDDSIYLWSNNVKFDENTKNEKLIDCTMFAYVKVDASGKKVDGIINKMECKDENNQIRLIDVNGYLASADKTPGISGNINPVIVDLSAEETKKLFRDYKSESLQKFFIEHKNEFRTVPSIEIENGKTVYVVLNSKAIWPESAIGPHLKNNHQTLKDSIKNMEDLMKKSSNLTNDLMK